MTSTDEPHLPEALRTSIHAAHAVYQPHKVGLENLAALTAVAVTPLMQGRAAVMFALVKTASR